MAEKTGALSVSTDKASTHDAASISQDPEKLGPDVSAELEKGKDVNGALEEEAQDPYLVTFTTPHDPDNPLDWPASKKWLVTLTISATGFNRIMVSTIMAPALTTIGRDLHMNSVEANMSMSAYLLATAIGPLLLAPLSEIYGRKPILHASNFFFLAWNIACGFADSKAVLITARVFAGLGASAVYTLGSGVLGDLYRPSERGKGMAIYMIVLLMAPAISPILGGFITQYTTWRWMFWSTSALQGTLALLSLISYHESYAPLILRRRASRIRKETSNTAYHTATERLDADRTVRGTLFWALTRPTRLLIFHPVIQIYTLYTGFSYGLLYLVLASYATLFTNVYGESISISGLHYIALAGGEMVGAQIGAPVLDWSYKKLKARAGGKVAPEFRLPLILPGMMCAFVGLIIYGWAAQYKVFWFVVDLGTFILMFGLSVAGNGIQAYIIDAYPDHVSSAMAAAQVLRSLNAFAFPLFQAPMYARLGYGWGNTLIAFLTIVVGIGPAGLLWKFGGKLRARERSSH